MFGVATVVGILECSVRLLPIDSLPGSLRVIFMEMRLSAEVFFHRDPYFQYVMAPNVDLLIQHPDFEYRVKTKLKLDHTSFRGGTLGGPAWGVALGDSFTFGMGVNHEATWVAQLANIANREIINLGVPGWGPQQYSRALERYGASLRPKIFFYAVYRNDSQDALLFDRWLGNPRYLQAVESFLRRNSVAYNLCRLMWTDSGSTTQDIELRELEVSFSSQKLKTSLTREASDFASSWSLIKREIEIAVGHSQRAGATLVLLYFPSKEEAYWELTTQKMRELKSFDDAIDMFRMNVVEFGKTRQVLSLDLTPALRRKAAEGVKLYFSHDSHWTEIGNRIVAEEVNQFLRARGLLN